MIEIIGCILLIIIGVSFMEVIVMLDKLEGTCQDCIYLEKIKPLFEKLEEENQELKKQLDKANSKMTSMFANGNEEKILDDLLELSNILEDKEV